MTDAIFYSKRIVIGFIDAIVGLIELLLGLRVILRFLDANTASAFVSWLYGVTDQLLTPFAGMFFPLVFPGDYVLEFSTLFAMLVYAFFGWLLIKLVSFVADAFL